MTFLYRFLFTASLLLLFNSLSAQKRIKIPELDYSTVDEFALQLHPPQTLNMDTLAAVIKKEYDKPHFRFRAAFRWVAENISYDLSHIKSPLKSYRNANDVFKEKKALSEGYVNLLQLLCLKMGITADVVHGYLRKDQLPGTVIKKPNHYWLSVKLYDKWYLMDVVLASGYIELKSNSFIKRFNDRYYAMHPRQIILTHLPLNGNKQFLDTIVDQKKFFRFPKVYDTFFDSDIYALTPADGIVNITKDQQKRFYFKTMDSLSVSRIEVRLGKNQQPIPAAFIQKDNVIYFDYVFEKAKKTSFDILIDGQLMATYLIMPKRKGST
jgi:hypothetical protein